MSCVAGLKSRPVIVCLNVLCGIFVMACSVLWTGTVFSQMARDGSLGQTPGSLAGPNYTIGVQNPAQQIHGNNLFHSFSDFNVNAGESATFTGPGSIANIINRVTGGHLSTVNGQIRSNIAGANLFLINPSGIVVGPNGSFSVSGSIHLSTADYLRLGSGNDRFYADLGKTSQLTTAPVTAFGFLGNHPGAISVQGEPGAPTLSVPTGQTFSLVGGDISITDRTISSVGGPVNLISIASAGEVVRNSSNGSFTPPTLTGFTQFGKITLSNNASIDTSTNQAVTTPIAAGAIYVRGGQLELDASSLKAISRGYDLLGDRAINPIADVQGGDIVVTAERVTLSGQSTIETGSARPPGVAGIRGVIGRDPTGQHIELTPGTIRFNVGDLLVKNSTIAVSSSVGEGKPGSLVIDGLAGPGTEANSVTVQNSAVRLDAGPQTGFVQNGGDVEIHSRDVLLDRLAYSSGAGDGKNGDIRMQSSNTIDIQNTDLGSASFLTFGKGGEIALKAEGEINLLATTLQSKTAIGLGAGDVTLSAPVINIRGGKLLTESTSLQAGNITFSVGTLTIAALQTDGSIQPAIVSSSGVQSVTTNQTGTFFGNPTQAGIITVQGFAGGGTAATSVVLDNSILATTTNSKNTSTMHPPTISIAAQNINLTNRAQVKADTSGEAPAGNIVLNAGGAITLTNGAAISSRSTGISGTLTIPEKAGLAGDITLTSGHNILLANSAVTTSAAEASGGNITLTAPNLVHLRNSQVTTSVTAGTGSGGNITIDPQFVVLQNSQILAQATQGKGGAISIVAGVLLADPASVINADSGNQALNGTVNIQAPLQQLSGAIAPLPQAFAVASNLYGQRCAAQKGGQFSSFLQGARDGVPPQPGDLIPSPLMLEFDEASSNTGVPSSPSLAAIRLGLPEFEQSSLSSLTVFAGCRS